MLFKPYLGKIYLKDSAKVVNAQDMLDLIVSFFDYASENEQVDSKKLTIRIGSPQEDKLINLLCDIFNPEQKGSLKLIVWDIALDYVKNKFRYPLWIAKYHNIAQSNEAVLSALDSIIELFKAVKDEEYSSEFVNTIYNKISSVQTDLRIIFNDTKNNPELFKKWLVSKKVNNISELNIGAIEEYIIKNSGEELVYTCEDETATYNRVLEFLLQKSNNGGINNPIDNDISTDNNGTEVIDTTNGNYTDTSETMRVVNILTNAGWDSKFIRIMEKILTSVPQAMNIVIKALQEEGINV